MKNLTSLLSVTLVALLAAGTAAAQNVPAGNNNIPGDAYWGNTGVDGMQPQAEPPRSIDEVMSSQVLSRKAKGVDEIPWVRAQTIQEAAAAYGAQAGQARRALEINQQLQLDSGRYDRVFNFRAVMLEPGFLPPVITEGRDAYNQPSDFQVRAADRIYKIEFPARLVNTSPRWQEYLMIPLSSTIAPDRTVLPKNDAEKAVWDEWARRGWAQGVALAEEAFRSNMGRLKRDFEGMLRYKTLYTQGLVSKPFLAKSNLGVTGGGDEMAINDRIFEITSKASLNPDRAKWVAPMPVTHPNDLKPGQPVTQPKAPDERP